MEYNNIRACHNDCILIYNEHDHLQQCPNSWASKFTEDVQGVSILVKIFRHFLIIRHIKNMLMCKSIVGLMTWHQTTRSTNKVMRVPTDSTTWRHIEEMWPIILEGPRSLNFGPANGRCKSFWSIELVMDYKVVLPCELQSFIVANS